MTISPSDFSSLQYLAALETDQTVDVNQDGSVNEPYHEANSYIALYNSASALLGYNNHYESLFSLFERALFSMHMRQGYLKSNIEQAIVGLQHLKETHEDEAETVATLDKVITFVAGKLEEWNAKPTENQVANPVRGDAVYSDLERSVFMLPSAPNITLTAETGISWLTRKITAFIQAAHELSDEDKQLLNQINTALADSSRWMRVRQAYELPEHATKTIGEVRAWIPQEIEGLIDSLEASPEDVRENIGLVIPFSFGYTACDHATTLGICQNKDLSFTLICCNAGLGAEVETFTFNWNINSLAMPFGKPIVEYGPLDRPAIIAFLTRLQAAKINTETAEQAAAAYKDLFENLPVHLKEYTIPSRRLQVSGNCTLRSPLEWVLFCLQKRGKVELANHLLQVSPARDTWDSPTIERVEPLVPTAGDTA